MQAFLSKYIWDFWVGKIGEQFSSYPDRTQNNLVGFMS